MTKPLTAAQKAANKKARAKTPKQIFMASKAAREAKRAERMPTKTAKQRAQKAAVALHDAGGAVTHAVPADKTVASKTTAQITEQLLPPAGGKLDLDTERKQPLKGVRGRVAPKADKPAAKRAKADKPAREKKYVDHGEGAAHRFSGIMWDGSRVRTMKGSAGLERSTDGATWTQLVSVDEFTCPNGDRWRRALQQAQRDKAQIPPNAAIGAKRAAAAGAESGAKPRRSSRKARNVEAPEEVDLKRWMTADVSTSCQFGLVFTPCKRTSTKRVVCCGGARFIDVCDSHEQQFLATKAPGWVGCKSYPLTPGGPKLPKEVPADAAEVTA